MRHSWLDGVCLLGALVLALWSISLGMELKWANLVTGSVPPGLIVVEPNTEAGFLKDKAFNQGRLLLWGMSLTLTCLPALWRKAPGRQVKPVGRVTLDRPKARRRLRRQ